MIQFGFGDVPAFDRYRSRSVWNVGKTGRISFKGNAVFGHGTKLSCGGLLEFGDNFAVTAESLIVCENEITFGKDVLISWHCQIMDTDFHKVLIEGQTHPNSAPIKIGDSCWIGSRVIINKGIFLLPNSIVASGAIVTKSFSEPNVLIGGVPATILRKNVSWEI